MNTVQAIFDWKCVAALGVGAVGVILAIKVDPSDAKEALVAVADALSMGTIRIDADSRS